MNGYGLFRNLFGAFLGGLLGILSLGYVNEWLLPFGCLAGVLLGYFHSALWNSLVQRLSRLKAKTVSQCVSLRAELREMFSVVGNCLRKVRAISREAWETFTSVCNFIRSLRTDMSRRMKVVWTLAILLFLSLNVLWMYPLLFSRAFSVFAGDSTGTGYVAFMLSGVCFAMTAAAFAISTKFEMTLGASPADRYRRDGGTLFFLRVFKNIIVCELVFGSILVGGLAWVIGGGLLFLALGVLPVLIFIGVIRSLDHILRRSGHLMCLGVTLTVTTVVACASYRYIEDTRLLWCAALLSGAFSALSLEVFRRSLLALFNLRRFQIVLRVNVERQLKPLFGWAERLTLKLGKVAELAALGILCLNFGPEIMHEEKSK